MVRTKLVVEKAATGLKAPARVAARRAGAVRRMEADIVMIENLLAARGIQL